MPVTIDARGLACPQPVIMAKKAIAENEEVTVLVDDDFAVENIHRMAANTACRFSVTQKEGKDREIKLQRTAAVPPPATDSVAEADEVACDIIPEKTAGPFVVVLSDNRMGSGDDVLGDILMRSFVHTLTQLSPLPDIVICYNAGVKLAVKDSAVLDDLRQLEHTGVDIIVCGTCVNYFGLGDAIAVGRISNMYEIVETLALAARILRP
jgi:selenium metabolism protein YedF